MIVLHPVLEILGTRDFGLWPVADSGTYGFLPLSGRLGTAEVGTAVMRIAECNTVDPVDEDRPQRPADPLGGFLHGLLTMEDLFAAGGLRVTDTATGVTLLPGCCNGLDERRDWFEVLDGDGWAGFGHDPSPLAERVGDTVRLTVDTERADSPVIELPVTDLRRLLAGAERDLAGFLRTATEWTTRYVPGHATAVAAALARALVLPAPTEGRVGPTP
ncbi:MULTISPECIES: hypothetical protein [unclassified Streptomyces]|uniref:hypothetical protein n=1 Tax=unclassified Streptomyces TaxID=2593676 RepID=UPI0016562F1E|nr:hypothetical protein [Streptomyces sp. CB02980]MCB8903071.1 hypothetical protein [Streptomyces sp. CB02980]